MHLALPFEVVGDEESSFSMSIIVAVKTDGRRGTWRVASSTGVAEPWLFMCDFFIFPFVACFVHRAFKGARIAGMHAVSTATFSSIMAQMMSFGVASSVSRLRGSPSKMRATR